MHWRNRSFVEQTFTLNPAACCPDVLIVDDEPFNIFTLRALLTKLNVAADEAMNGERAIEKIVKANSRLCGCRSYQIVFMDVHMPVLNGIEVNNWLTIQQFTGYGENRSLDKAGDLARAPGSGPNRRLICERSEELHKEWNVASSGKAYLPGTAKGAADCLQGDPKNRTRWAKWEIYGFM